VTRAELVAALRTYKLAVEATVAPDGAPQAATVGVAVSDAGELVFDTLTTTRKYANLVANPRVALVLGEGEITIQVEGIADVPAGAELERMKQVYFAIYPDGRERAAWPNITWVRVTPTWARYSDFTTERIEVVTW
jgi:general stress protein 26